MCLIIIAYRTDPDYPLIVAANRDEMYQRPTRAAGFWCTHPSILAGQDLEYGGSWLGVDKQGRLAAVTNYRDGKQARSGVSSRGLLVSHYLQGHYPAVEYLEQCLQKLNNFNGFNLLLGDSNALYFLSSRGSGYQQLQAGIFGISNGEFDAPWPKVVWARQQLSALIAARRTDDHAAILAILADRQLPADETLPDTGIGLEWERLLSPVFIKTENYGTRSSTVLTLDRDAKVRFSERGYDSQGTPGATGYFEFTLENGE